MCGVLKKKEVCSKQFCSKQFCSKKLLSISYEHMDIFGIFSNKHDGEHRIHFNNKIIIINKFTTTSIAVST